MRTRRDAGRRRLWIGPTQKRPALGRLPLDDGFAGRGTKPFVSQTSRGRSEPIPGGLPICQIRANAVVGRAATSVGGSGEHRVGVWRPDLLLHRDAAEGRLVGLILASGKRQRRCAQDDCGRKEKCGAGRHDFHLLWIEPPLARGDSEFASMTVNVTPARCSDGHACVTLA